MAHQMPQALTIPQRVVVRKALKSAIGLCDIVLTSNDQDLGATIEQVMGARPTANRVAGIKRDFTRIRQALSRMTEENFDTLPGGRWYAEVDPVNAGHITLGDDFWVAARKGIDSTAGTLVHEASHWTVVRGTDDHAYGDEINRLSYTLARNNAETLERIAEGREVERRRRRWRGWLAGRRHRNQSPH